MLILVSLSEVLDQFELPLRHLADVETSSANVGSLAYSSSNVLEGKRLIRLKMRKWAIVECCFHVHQHCSQLFLCN